MILLCIFIHVGYPHLPRRCGIGVAYKFFKCSSVPQVDSSIDLRANVFSTSYKADALQNNCLENDPRSTFHFQSLIMSSSAARLEKTFP